MASASQTYTYKYEVNDIYLAITDSILRQMQGKGKKNNIVLTNPKPGQVSDYLLRKGTKELPVHFEIIRCEKPHIFEYEMVYQNVSTISTWELDDYDAETTHVSYTERSGKDSILYTILGFFNKKKFNRTATNYFVMIDSVLENKIVPEKMKANAKPQEEITMTAASLADLTVLELRTLAEEKEIDLAGKRLKEEIIAELIK